MIAPAKKTRPRPSLAARQALQAMRRGIREAARQSRRAGIPMVVWQNNRITLLRP